MQEIIRLEKLNYIYQKGTPFEFHALRDVDLSVKKGEILGIVGPTGSGKSTLVQHFNGLLRPTSGKIFVAGREISGGNKKKNDKKADLAGLKTRTTGLGERDPETSSGQAAYSTNLCFDVGLVFQYPEYQLFEETVFDDVAFGPKNMGLAREMVEERVRRAMEWMSLDFDKFKDRSPFSLSGGEMRRVALAGVLAMEPQALILDEPTAGLDPRGCRELKALIRRFHENQGLTLVMVSHEMGEIARMADHLVILHRGEVVADGAPIDIFRNYDKIEALGLGLPPYMDLMKRLRARGFDVRDDVLDSSEALEEILKLFRKKT
jgi:energy-coupling factor transport system ATP-binding protein